MSATNHSNWRYRAIRDLSEGGADSIHFTSVYAISRADAEKMKEIIAAAIVKQKDLAAPSREEEIFCFNCDFFRV
jgi:hypothetical protein